MPAFQRNGDISEPLAKENGGVDVVCIEGEHARQTRCEPWHVLTVCKPTERAIAEFGERAVEPAQRQR